MSAVKKPVPTLDEMNNLAWSIASTVSLCETHGYTVEQRRILTRDGLRWRRMMGQLHMSHQLRMTQKP